MRSSFEELTHLWSRGCSFLSVRYAILGGAMTWVSDSRLVSAISNAGAFGVLASGTYTPDQLKIEIKKTQNMTSQSFAVNLILLHPQLHDLIDVCAQQHIAYIVLAGGIPGRDVIHKIQGLGIQILAFAPSLGLARKLVKLGVNALIVEGNEAGGHIGPVSTSVLAQEILPHIQEVPVFVAGGIGRGEAIGAYLTMGAAGCQLGTRFVCAMESHAHPSFKQAFIRAQARDALPSVQLDPRFPVIPVRAIQNKATQRFSELQRDIIQKYDSAELSLKDAQLEIEHFWAGALKCAVHDGDVENGSLMAGQSVGMVDKEQPMQEIIQELIEGACLFLDKNKRRESSSEIASVHAVAS